MLQAAATAVAIVAYEYNDEYRGASGDDSSDGGYSSGDHVQSGP